MVSSRKLHSFSSRGTWFCQAFNFCVTPRETTVFLTRELGGSPRLIPCNVRLCCYSSFVPVTISNSVSRYCTLMTPSPSLYSRSPVKMAV